MGRLAGEARDPADRIHRAAVVEVRPGVEDWLVYLSGVGRLSGELDLTQYLGVSLFPGRWPIFAGSALKRLRRAGV